MIRVKRTGDNSEWEIPDGPIPPGFTKIESPLAPRQPLGSPFESHGLMGPGLLANLDARIRGKTLAESEQHINKTLNMALPMAAGLYYPGAGALGTSAVQAAYQALAAAATKHGIKSSIWQGILGGSINLGMQTLAQPAKLAANWAAARVAEHGYKAKKAFDKAMADALNILYKQGHEQEVAAITDAYEAALPKAIRDWKAGTSAANAAWVQQVKQAGQQFYSRLTQHGERGAKSLMDFAKQKIASWRDLPSDVRGLTDAVLGQGQRLVSKQFDDALREMIAQGSGKTVGISRQAAEQLGVAFKDSKIPGLSVRVDAGELAKRMVGRGMSAREAYREGIQSLESIGLSNAEAREAYTTAQGIIETINQSKALRGKVTPEGDLLGVLNSRKIEEALYDPNIVDELRRRGVDMGDVFRGPFQVFRGGPLKPTLPPKPVAPPKPTKADIPKPDYPQAPSPLSPPETVPPDITRSSTKDPMRAAGAVLGGLVGHGLGHPYIGIMAGGALGQGVSKKLPEVITKAPGVDPQTIQAIELLAAQLGAGASGLVKPKSPLTPLTITPTPSDSTKRKQVDEEWQQRFGNE